LVFTCPEFSGGETLLTTGVTRFTLAQLRRHRKALPALATVPLAVLLAASGIALIFHFKSGPAHAKKDAEHDANAAFTNFWAPFLVSGEDPFVVYSNATFVGSAETGMRYYEPSRDKGTDITQHYTGVGEVMAVLDLDRLFQKFGRRFHVKRSGLFTMDDARNNKLIFIGSPTENLTLGKLSNSFEFQFLAVLEGPNHWQQTIVDKHPHPTGPTGRALRLNCVI
jgi:hypothetical protein